MLGQILPAKNIDEITPYISVLGNLQDGRSPHIGCKKKCCIRLTNHQKSNRKITSLGLILPYLNSYYLFEATPDIEEQLESIESNSKYLLDGIFLTHAHIGHYSGLIFFVREALGSINIKTYTMPRLESLIRENGPWSQLVEQKNIVLKKLINQTSIQISDKVKVIPFIVPHRDEYSETVGYKIIGPNKTALFIPDIDKWERWNTKIEELIKDVDIAWLDDTFFDQFEIKNISISEIPHPLVIETMKRLNNMPQVDRKKIYFIHLNHTNPLINLFSQES